MMDFGECYWKKKKKTTNTHLKPVDFDIIISD